MTFTRGIPVTPPDNSPQWREFFQWVATERDKKLSQHKTLKSAVDSLSAAGELELLIDKNGPITADLTIPANITLRVLPGFTVGSSGYTLTHNGAINAGRWQIFATGATIATSANGRQRFAFPEWWGPNTTPGTTDMSAEIQAAIDFAESGKDGYNNAPYVDLAPATYLVSSTLTIMVSGVSIGCSTGLATLARTGNYGATISLNASGSSYQNDNFIENITFYQHTSAPTSGDYHIFAEACARFRIEGCHFVDGWVNIFIKGCIIVRINRCDGSFSTLLGSYTAGTGHLLFIKSSTSPSPTPADIFVTDCDFQTGYTNRAQLYNEFVVAFYDVDGAWFQNCHFRAPGSISLLFYPSSATSYITSVKFTNCYIDGAGRSGGQYGVGMSFSGTAAGALKDIKYIGGEIFDGFNDGGSTYGIVIGASSPWEDIQIIGTSIAWWGYHGIYNQSTLAKNIQIKDCTIISNNTYNSGASNYSAIALVSGTTAWMIQNNSIGRIGDTVLQNYAVYGAGTLLDSIITGNLCKNNTETANAISTVGAQTRCTVDNNETTAIP